MRREGKLTRVLLTDLLTGFRRPLAAEVLDPLRGWVGLGVEGQLGRIQPVGDVQEAAHAHHKAASWKSTLISFVKKIKEKDRSLKDPKLVPLKNQWDCGSPLRWYSNFLFLAWTGRI